MSVRNNSISIDNTISDLRALQNQLDQQSIQIQQLTNAKKLLEQRLAYQQTTYEANIARMSKEYQENVQRLNATIDELRTKLTSVHQSSSLNGAHHKSDSERNAYLAEHSQGSLSSIATSTPSPRAPSNTNMEKTAKTDPYSGWD